MKPNDAITLIIALHILFISLIAYILIRTLRRVRPRPVSSPTYTSYRFDNRQFVVQRVLGTQTSRLCPASTESAAQGG
jgi:hypothetical protein